MNTNVKNKYSNITPQQISKLIESNQFSFISGPISFVSFDDNGRKFYLFGDEHFDKLGNCETKYKDVKIPCLPNSKKQVCYDFVYFLEKLFQGNEESDDYIDFYLETPFKRRYMRENESGESDYITSIEKVFVKCFRRDKSKCKYKKTRFHYIDFRIKDVKNVASINYIPVNFIHVIKNQIIKASKQKYVSKLKLINKIRFYNLLTKRLFRKNINQKLLNSYFRDNFQETMREIYKNITKGLNLKKYKRYLRIVKRIFTDASKYYKIRNGKKVHLIKSQLDALRKERVKFKNQEMANIIEDFVKNNYKNRVDTNLFQAYWKDYIGQLENYLKDNKLINKDTEKYNNLIQNFVLGSIIEMDAHIFDAYLLGRLFRTFNYTTQQEHIPSNTVVIYAGNYHIQNYVNFFTQVLGIKPEISTGPINHQLKRCVFSPKIKSEFQF